MIKHVKKVALAVGFAAATAAIIAGCASDSEAKAQGTPLVYVCQQQPCTNAQEFEVFDSNGNPIYSVGEYGGDAVFGDNRSVYAPGNVYTPSVVESYTTPALYAAAHPGSPAGCTAPEMWIWPGGIDTCAGKNWVRAITFP